MVPTSTDVTVQLKDQIPPAAEAVAVFVHKETKAGDESMAGWPAGLREQAEPLLRAGVVTGKSNEVTAQLLDGEAAGGSAGRRLLVVGLGAREKFSAECLREAGGTLGKYARRHKIKSLAVVPPAVPEELPGLPQRAPAGAGPEVAAEALATGFLLGSFEFREYKGTAGTKGGATQSGRAGGVGKKGPTQLTVIVPGDGGREWRDAVDRARAVADGQNFARTIASRPGNDINPVTLAKVAQDLARDVGMTFRVLDERQMAKLGMGGILAVGAGSSATPPRMIVLEYQPAGRKSAGGKKGGSRAAQASPLLVVGKAITFDTGGISIKPAEKMGRMIFDKSGGMTVLGLMYAVATLRPPVPVVGILSSAENHISETAYRPGDILRMYNGVTVEVTNTDAEGRLVLGDALAWGIETYRPAAVVDLATLTGGVIVALGKTMAGVMSNDDGLVAELTRAGEVAGEKIWRLPLGDDQRDHIKSEPADIVNSGGREGHPLQGGAFLSHFVQYEGKDKIPWAHLDIAGVADTEKELPTYAKGSTGWGVRTLVQWVRTRAGLIDSANGSTRSKDKKVPPPAGG